MFSTRFGYDDVWGYGYVGGLLGRERQAGQAAAAAGGGIPAPRPGSRTARDRRGRARAGD